MNKWFAAIALVMLVALLPVAMTGCVSAEMKAKLISLEEETQVQTVKMFEALKTLTESRTALDMVVAEIAKLEAEKAAGTLGAEDFLAAIEVLVSKADVLRQQYDVSLSAYNETRAAVDALSKKYDEVKEQAEKEGASNLKVVLGSLGAFVLSCVRSYFQHRNDGVVADDE